MDSQIANATYACPWCKIKAEDRHLDLDHMFACHEKEFLRNIEEMVTAAEGTYGKKENPFLRIPIIRVIPCLLHLLLRITDKLEANLIDEAVDRDNRAKVLKQVGGYLDRLVEKIKDIVPSFQLWNSKDAKNGREYDWSSMNGTEKYKVLQCLPDLLRGQNILHPETEGLVLNVWSKFKAVYDEINSEAPSHTEAYNKACLFQKAFLSLSGQRKGYKKSNVSPYMHALVAHVPYFIHVLGNLKQFSGQATEKVMDDMKKIHQKASQKLDSAKEALVVRKRVEILHQEGCKRKTRSYKKKDDKYWGKGICEVRKRQKAKIESEKVELQVNYEEMSEQKLRLFLKKNFGVSTKVRSKRKLIDMLNKSMQNGT